MRKIILRSLAIARRGALDLSILAAWAAVVTGIMLTIFYTRSCQGDPPCQSPSDFGLFFIAAVGAGLVLDDERLLVVGFMVVHFLSTMFFVISLTAPGLLGLTGPAMSDSMLNMSIVIAFKFQFPVAVLLSLLGSGTGAFIGDKLRLSG